MWTARDDSTDHLADDATIVLGSDVINSLQPRQFVGMQSITGDEVIATGRNSINLFRESENRPRSRPNNFRTPAKNRLRASYKHRLTGTFKDWNEHDAVVNRSADLHTFTILAWNGIWIKMCRFEKFLSRSTLPICTQNSIGMLDHIFDIVSSDCCLFFSFLWRKFSLIKQLEEYLELVNAQKFWKDGITSWREMKDDRSKWIVARREMLHVR